MNWKSSSQIISLEEALDIWSKVVNSLKISESLIPIEESLGRVTSKEVKARLSNPFCVLAALDGIAVNSSQTIGAKISSPKKLIINKDAFRINTGEPLPEGTDAVIAVENLLSNQESEVEIGKAASLGEGLRQPGEDILEGDTLILEGTIITPQLIGLMAQGGIKELAVYSQPKVGIMPTGEEVVPHTEEHFKPGQVINSNTPMIQAMVKSWGGEPVLFPVTANERETLTKSIEVALSKVDILLIIAGSSKGSKDLVPHILKTMGEVLVKGVAIKPARPTTLALVNGKPVINLPGYPVSAYLAAHLFLRPLLYSWQGLDEPPLTKVAAVMSTKVPKEVGVKEYLRVYLGKIGEEQVAYPLARGAGIMSSIALADGWVVIPSNLEGLEEEAKVEVELLKPLTEVEGNLIILGSHDLSLEVITELLRKKSRSITLKPVSTGSLSGLQSFKKNKVAICGLHLLDETTAEYNLPFIKNLDRKAVLINLVFREQGLIVPKGNPKNIRNLTDLTSSGVRFVNRQRGAGTRVLLDYLLKKEGISPSTLQGYDDEDYTHLGVALRVRDGQADVGLGIRAVANLYGLDFIPIHEERYDLLISGEQLTDFRIKAFLETINSKEFKERLENLGGYRTDLTGKVIWENH